MQKKNPNKMGWGKKKRVLSLAKGEREQGFDHKEWGKNITGGRRWEKKNRWGQEVGENGLGKNEEVLRN